VNISVSKFPFQRFLKSCLLDSLILFGHWSNSSAFRFNCRIMNSGLRPNLKVENLKVDCCVSFLTHWSLAFIFSDLD